jgi:four helix bundle protein
MQDFHQLRVWQRAHELSLAVKKAARGFPRVGQSESKSQLIRAVDSIASNIVEGCGAASRKEFARYLDISIKSASEVEYRLQLAYDDACISYRVWQRLSNQVIEIRKMLFRLRKSVIAADEAEQKRRRADRKSSKEDRKPITHDP